ncbi:MAG: hypothetical protein ABI729_03525 [Chitinophagales bacterium]
MPVFLIPTIAISPQSSMSNPPIFIYLLAFFNIFFLESFQSNYESDQTTKSCLENFTGKWQADSNSNNYQFSIEFFCNNKALQGQHCYISKDGKKIDCFQDTEMSIKLEKVISKSEIMITVKSAFCTDTAVVNLKMEDGKLIWDLIKTPQGEHYFPKRINLVKAN